MAGVWPLHWTVNQHNFKPTPQHLGDDHVCDFHHQGYDHSGYVGYGSCSGYGVIREEGQVRPKSASFSPSSLKGKIGEFLLLAQSFYRPQTKRSLNRQNSLKRPKVGQKSGQRVQNWPNKNQVASELLRASTNSVIRAAEGIHQFCHQSYWGNPLVGNFSIRPAEGIHRFCHRSYWGNPSILLYDLLRESTRVYISYRWLSFKYNCTFRTYVFSSAPFLLKPM